MTSHVRCRVARPDRSAGCFPYHKPLLRRRRDGNSFLVETRSSTSLNAALQDLALVTFDTFRPDLVVTKADGVPSAAPGDLLTTR